jgi:FkbH-like protein
LRFNAGMIENKVKLVVWDLDETFWAGTLAEGGITPVERNLEIVRELARRGIVSAICSKNDYETAKAKLVELGIWDCFTFPRIAFAPKGQAIAELVETAGLRPENVLFLDDNFANLEEAKFFCPGIMTALASDALDGLLDHPHLAGSPDPELKRLKQYQVLQRKAEERDTSALSNEEFLRASDIRIEIGYDLDADFDRVVELVNRANQLNYTKRRLDTPKRVERFRERLRTFGRFAGTVRARDRYGDYGLIGFFQMKQKSHGKRLGHFVFSCRTMNMGIEQYVYERLGRPEIEIEGEVATPLDTHAKIDWITEASGGAHADVKSPSLLLLGGCDLLQLASYCSNDRMEFVNRAEAGATVRYDDPGFILSDRDAARNCESLNRLPLWTSEDAQRFDAAVASRGMIIVSLWAGMNGNYFRTPGGVLLRMTKPQEITCRTRDPDFASVFEEVDLDHPQRLEYIVKALDSIGGQAKGPVFVLGCNSRDGMQIPLRRMYNDACRAYCDDRGAPFVYVDVDDVVPEDCLTGGAHFSREGYFAIAQHILARVGDPPGD